MVSRGTDDALSADFDRFQATWNDAPLRQLL